ncbi:dihydrodipicolinate synthase family protein [Uliginosibacterium sp. 31-16]|uniref:dihydrodipicolinate synthase family protein n=1 Tax=Uliginosibacterium sp. 31-16 TaxID=3068315 RepID=UPI00273EC8F5|nr:dihydrodipicolinate synthase family protein [Uliginosibacterium sp. 31-16]MDP5241031.1 dihydrodipicolinate synthase family protein [Uliginosibacterium sp. 31-16]
MAMRPLFRGNIPPVPTIWTAAGQLDRTGMGNMLDFVINGGADVVFCCGSAGEFSQMSEAQRREVAEFAVSHVAGRVPVLIGIASCSTQQAIEFGLHAKAIGASGVVAVNPYYALLLPDNIMLHYRRLAAAVDLPLILYNFPLLTGQDLSPAMIRQLALECPNIVGVKDTTDTVRHIRDVLQAVKPVRPDFGVYAGFDEYMLDTLIMGGDGCFPSAMNFAPHIPVGLWRAFQEKDGAKLIEMQRQLCLCPPMFGLESPFYAIVKEAAKMVGVDISTHVLPPAVPLTEAKRDKVRDTLRLLGVVS